MAFNFAANVSQAINFLTLPLIITQTADMVSSVQSVLRSTLSTALASSRGQLSLSCSPSFLPPRPILAACIACDFFWDDWMALLGNRDFDLTIESHDVLVTYFDLSRPYTITIWSEPTHDPMTRPLLAKLRSFDVPHVPISKLGQRTKKSNVCRKPSTTESTFTRPRKRTLAQQLLEENHKQEADEIFEMISKMSILSPTPTRQDFPTLQLPSLATGISIQSPSSPEAISVGGSSRPSSRSSTFSGLSLSDDEGSITSASSIASFDFCHSDFKRHQTERLNTTSPVFVPRYRRDQILEEESGPVIVDSDKKDKVKYLYQGGYTTVVTGGVMLGGGAPSKKADGPRHRTLVTGRKKSISFPAPVNKRMESFHSWTSSTPSRI